MLPSNLHRSVGVRLRMLRVPCACLVALEVGGGTGQLTVMDGVTYHLGAGKLTWALCKEESALTLSRVSRPCLTEFSLDGTLTVSFNLFQAKTGHFTYLPHTHAGVESILTTELSLS